MEGDEKIHIPEDVEREVYAEMRAYDKEQKEKWEKAKKELEGLIHPKYFVYAESHDTFHHEGIVEMDETDEKQNGYGTKQRNCRVRDSDDTMLYMYTTGEVESFFGEESEFDGESIEYWVWQTTGYACDDYSGYQLFPMKDGRYWKISYSC